MTRYNVKTLVALVLGLIAAGGLLLATAEAPLAGAETPLDYTADMTLGSPDAPVKIIEYASMTCSHCGHFHRTTFPELKAQYIDTGKVQFTFREFPFDRPALQAAMTARCAGPDRFFGFLKVFFDQQPNWISAPDPRAAIGRFAKMGGMGASQFEACMADEALSKQLLQTRLGGEREFEVNATPTFIINGTKHAGALTFKQMDAILKEMVE